MRQPKSQSKRVRRAPGETQELLRSQLLLLRSSAAAFDAGTRIEAPRLATCVRILVHDSGSSTSLLQQLGIKRGLVYLDSGEEILPSNKLPTNGLALMEMVADPQKPRAHYVAALDDGLQWGKWATFSSWWTRNVIKDREGNLFSRRTLVLAVSNTDGGAHVDPELDEAYSKLTRSNSLGWTYGGAAGPSEPMGDPVPPSIRQIAFEIEFSLGQQLGAEFTPQTSEAR